MSTSSVEAPTAGIRLSLSKATAGWKAQGGFCYYWFSNHLLDWSIGSKRLQDTSKNVSFINFCLKQGFRKSVQTSSCR